MAADLTFFSYARADSNFVLKLATDLRNAGIKIWLDQLDIKPGSRWDTSIENALNESTGMIIVLSPASIASNNVLDEVNYALEKNKRVIPVFYKECATPFRLRRLQRIDFTGNYPTALQALLGALTQHAGETKKVETEKPLEDRTHATEDNNNDDKLWEEAKRGNTIESYQKYIDNSKPGQHQREAKKIVAELESAQRIARAQKDVWEQAIHDGDIESFRHYLKIYPHGIYSKNAWAAIERLTKQTSATPSSVVSKTKSGKHKSNLRKRILIAGAGVAAVLIAWLIIAGSSSKKSSYTYSFNNVEKTADTRYDIHRGGILSVEVSPDGKNILTGSRDSTACLLDLKGNVLKRFDGHSGDVFIASFAPDGKSLFTGSRDQTARLWSATGTLLQEFKGPPGEIFIAAFSPDGKTICTASEHVARVWNVNGTLMHEFRDSGFIVSMAFSPDGKKLLFAGDAFARVCDLEGNVLNKWKAHTSLITHAVFSPDGKTLATASWDSVVSVWDINGNELATFNHETESGRSIAFSPDGQKIASASGREAFVSDLKGNIEWQITKFPLFITSLAFSPDGKQLFLGTSHGTMIVIP